MICRVFDYRIKTSNIYEFCYIDVLNDNEQTIKKEIVKMEGDLATIVKNITADFKNINDKIIHLTWDTEKNKLMRKNCFINNLDEEWLNSLSAEKLLKGFSNLETATLCEACLKLGITPIEGNDFIADCENLATFVQKHLMSFMI